MDLIKERLTEVAVDSFTDYLKEKIEKIKQLDLDHDGQKDVDQLKEIVANCGLRVKNALESTDFPKLAEGLDNVMKGANMIATAFDGKLLAEAGQELSKGMEKVGQLAQLAIEEAKEKNA